MRLSKLLSRFSLCLLLPLFSTLTFPLAHAQTADIKLADAQRLLKKGQHAQALNAVDGYLTEKPKEAQGRFTKGLILTEMKRTGEAILVFKKLTEDFPELPEPYNNLAVLYAQEKQYDKARQALEAAIKTHPAYAVAHENLGDIYAKLASQAYGKALQIDAGNTAAQSKMAMIRDLVPPASSGAGKPAPKSGSEPIRIASTDPARLAYPTASGANGGKPSVSSAPVGATAPAPAPNPAPVAAMPTKPAAVASVPSTPPPAKATPALPENDPINALNDWVSAWSAKNVGAYLAAYAPDFQVPGGLSRSAWETERRNRIDKPGKIEVSVENVAVETNGADKANIKFRQVYRSANLKTSTTKTLVMVRLNGRWLIQQERVKQ